MIGGAALAPANDLKDCQLRIARAENKLQEEIQKHGADSKQAKNRMRQLQEEHERCALLGYGGNWTDHGYQVPHMDPRGYDYRKLERERDCKEENERRESSHDSKHGHNADQKHNQPQQSASQHASQPNNKNDRAKNSR
jgi:hypothetical protein